MPPAQSARVLIKARWIIPVVPENRVLENCALVIVGNNIAAILPWAEAEKRYRAEQTICLDQHVLIPGLINAHGHAAMTLLRGYADDLPLKSWLEEHIWPAEQRHVDKEFVADGTRLAIAEMIKTGTTCFADMYFFPEEAARVARQAHMRSQIAFPVLEFANNWASTSAEAIEKGLALRDEYRDDDLISIAFGPHAPYTVADDTLKNIAVLAQELDTPVHIHLHETAHEVEESLQLHGMRPTERLEKLGLLSELTQCVHMTQVNDADITLLTQSGAHVIHCPQSNLKLASGFCPTARLLAAGVNVALGTDGAASNNDLDLLAELETAVLIGKAVAGDPKVLNAHEALKMATLNGARALGIDERTGSLEPGKAADIAAISLDGLGCQPLYNPASGLVYGSRSASVSHVWIDGKAVLLSGHLQTLNEREIKAQAEAWQDIIVPSEHPEPL